MVTTIDNAEVVSMPSTIERVERNADRFKKITAKQVSFPYDARTADIITNDMYLACFMYDGENVNPELDATAYSGLANTYRIFASTTEHFRTVYRAMMLDHTIRHLDGNLWETDRFGYPVIGDYLEGCYRRLKERHEGTVNAEIGIPAWHGLIPEGEGGTDICSVVVEHEGARYGVQPYGLMTEWDKYRVLCNLCSAGYEQAIHDALRGIRNVLPELGYLPNSGEIQTLTRVLASGGNPRNSAVTRSEKWEIVSQQDEGDSGVSSITFTRKNRDETHTIRISNPDIVFPGQTSDKHKRGTIITRKLLPYVLQKMVQQGYPRTVFIDLQEMVDLGMYSNRNNAWRAIERFVEQMATVFMSANTKGRKGKQRGNSGVIFYNAYRSDGTVQLSVNDAVDLSMFASVWTVFPKWAYGLSAGPFDLVRYVFFIARQNSIKISESGKFTISLQAVAEAMGLPSPDEVKNRRYRQQIRKPIEDAIEEIEQRVADTPEAKGKFFITPYTDDTTTDIDRWLQGYVEVQLRDDYVTSFTAIADKTKALVERAKVAQERREKAKVNQ